jgi:hypothetical protein
MRASIAGSVRTRWRADATNPFQIWSGGAWVNPNLSQVAAPQLKRVAFSETSITTTLANSAFLTGYSLDASSTYEFEAFIPVISSGGADLKLALSFSNAPQSSYGSIINNKGIFFTVDGVIWSSLTSSITVNIQIGYTNYLHIKGMIQSNASLASTMTLQFAQNTVDVSLPTFLSTNSLAKIRKVV